MRNDYVHGIDSEVHTRPQKKDPKLNAFMWSDPYFAKEIELNAKKSISILFEAMDKLKNWGLSY